MNFPGRLASTIVVFVAWSAMAGCGSSRGVAAMSPISVSLATPTVVVSTDGTPAYVQLVITSTSETALVSFVGLPGGVQVTYAATDTNPSGLLTFKAGTAVSAGTYMPFITVYSAGQTATFKFTLIVAAAMNGG